VTVGPDCSNFTDYAGRFLVVIMPVLARFQSGAIPPMKIFLYTALPFCVGNRGNPSNTLFYSSKLVASDVESVDSIDTKESIDINTIFSCF
jgi:hypothetical protein